MGTAEGRAAARGRGGQGGAGGSGFAKPDPRQPVALYFQVRQALMEQILDGRLKPGDRLQPEDRLAEELGVSRITVRRALQELADDGWLTRQQGRGTFVAAPKLERRLFQLTSFIQEMQAQGHQVATRLLEVRREIPAEKVLRALGLGADEGPGGTTAAGKDARVLSIARLREVDGRPAVYQISYLPLDLEDAVQPERLASESLYDQLARRVRLARAEETLEPVLLTAAEARLLDVQKGAPAFLSQRTSFATGGRPVLFDKALIRGDRIRIVAEVRS